MCFFDCDVNCPFNCPLVSDFHLEPGCRNFLWFSYNSTDEIHQQCWEVLDGVGWCWEVRSSLWRCWMEWRSGFCGGASSGRHKASRCSLKISHTVELLIFLPYNKNMSTQTESATFTGRLRKHLSPPCVQRWNIWTMSCCDSTKYDNKKTLYCKKNAHDRNRGTISEPMSDDCCDAVLMKWRVQPDRVSHQCFLSARLTDLQIS